MPTDESRQAISEFLFVERKPESVDLAVVMGSEWLPTIDPAIHLFNKGATDRILITGGSYQGKTSPKSEAQRLLDRAVEAGVALEAILIEDKSTNTLENFLYSRDVIESQIGWKQVNSVAFICKSFHSRRVLMTAEKHWPSKLDYFIIPIIDERNITRANWHTFPVGRTRVLEELQRIATYTLKGDIGGF